MCISLQTWKKQNSSPNWECQQTRTMGSFRSIDRSRWHSYTSGNIFIVHPRSEWLYLKQCQPITNSKQYDHKFMCRTWKKCFQSNRRFLYKIQEVTPTWCCARESSLVDILVETVYWQTSAFIAKFNENQSLVISPASRKCQRLALIRNTRFRQLAKSHGPSDVINRKPDFLPIASPTSAISQLINYCMFWSTADARKNNFGR